MTFARVSRTRRWGRRSIRWERSSVAHATNFGDPSFEPTDEELAELMHEAFAEVPARNAEALARIHSEIAVLRDLRLGLLAALYRRLFSAAILRRWFDIMPA